MPAPLIGVTASYSPAEGSRAAQFTVYEAYLQSILNAGGLPVIIPPALAGQPLRELFARLDGILFTGGGDIDPLIFGGQPHPRVYGIEPARDTLEIELVRLAAAENKPFLGICRGIQVVNVALGGTLFTDIADQHTTDLKHDNWPGPARSYLAHSVWIEEGSRLAAILGSQEKPVNSLHHQGLQQVAPGLRASACAPDQLVEAVELPDHRFGLAVQWHPEWLQDDPAQRALFRALVEAAQP
jgi:putative glutamine amidotransferase